MSAKATFWAWDQELKSSEKLVLLCIADCHNADTNRCDPSVLYIAKKTGLNRKTVMTSIEGLEKKSMISSEKLIGKQNKYSINFHAEISKKPVPETVLIPKTVLVPNLPPTSTKNGTTPVPNLGHEPISNLKDNLKDKAYAFFGDRIKLTFDDLEKAKKQYPNLDLKTELEQLDLELKNETDKSWFMTMHSKLNYRNRRGNTHASTGYPNQSARKQTPAERAYEQGRVAIARAELLERETNQTCDSTLESNGPVISRQVGTLRGANS